MRRIGFLRSGSARVTNLQLLLALLITFATGAGAEATGSERGRWIVIAHGLGAMAVIALIPWKTRVVRSGVRRHRWSRWFSLTLAALVILTLLLGLGYTTGLVRSVGGVGGMWLHVAVALTLVPLLLWHLVVRWARPRRTDLSRRTALRLGAIGVVATGAYVATAGAVTLLGLPGARRRFTGSYETASHDPARMPATIWLNDTVPALDADTWRLTIVEAGGRREHTLASLRRDPVTVRATLDCTSGWYADQDWTGTPLAKLIDTTGQDSARSLMVHSATGYSVLLPIEDLDHLLLATDVGGRVLRPGHGYPLRLVVPHRRGFWWVKWVDRIELDERPWWLQPPVPPHLTPAARRFSTPSCPTPPFADLGHSHTV